MLRMFGGRSAGDDIVEKMMERAQKFVLIGRKIADDCVEQGLRNGEFTMLSDMEKFIRSNHLYNTEAVINGFLTRLRDYIAAEEVINISVQGGDILLAHRDHVSTILKKLNGEEPAQDGRSAAKSEQSDSNDGIKKEQEALARDIALFLTEINNTGAVLNFVCEA